MEIEYMNDGKVCGSVIRDINARLSNGFLFSCASLRHEGNCELFWSVCLFDPNRNVILINQDLSGDAETVAGWIDWAMEYKHPDVPYTHMIEDEIYDCVNAAAL